jgi:hypothetical protein
MKKLSNFTLKKSIYSSESCLLVSELNQFHWDNYLQLQIAINVFKMFKVLTNHTEHLSLYFQHETFPSNFWIFLEIPNKR